MFSYSPVLPDAPDFETRLWTMRADGRHARPLPMRRPGFDNEPRYSPDGARILVMCERQGTLPEPPADHNEDICVLHADGSNIINPTNTPDVFENWPSGGLRRTVVRPWTDEFSTRGRSILP